MALIKKEDGYLPVGDLCDGAVWVCDDEALAGGARYSKEFHTHWPRKP